MNDRPKDPSASVPRVPSDMSERLRQKHGDDLDPNITLTGAGEERGGSSGPRAANPTTSARSGERYTFEGEIARGGMGAVLGVYDGDLRRKLAMKVILTDAEGSVANSTLGRFLEEAQVTAQLDHPGVVPVHEMGLDGDGQVYFTMKLVKGEDLRSVFDKVKSGEDGWNTTRVVNLLLRVCEAVAFAHSKGVIHRDLKPANIMVGRFGEVYVMDWGIARVQGKEDRKDLRIRADAPQTSIVHSDRHASGTKDDSPDSPLLTLDGDVVGTPAYMPIEQAEGRIEEIGPESDVYSLGTILYELLAGQMPYVPPGARMSARTIHYAVLQGPPKPLEELAPSAPPELVAIADKAMARSKKERYSTTGALAEDLRAYLENRVVRAYRTGALIELRKWVQRNKGLAVALAAGLLLLLGLGVMTAAAVEKGKKNDELDAANGNLQSTIEQRDDANKKLDRRNRLLGDLEVLRELRSREAGLWPARPEQQDGMVAWLRDARDLLDGIPGHEAELEELAAQAAEVDETMIEAALRPSERLQEYEDLGTLIGLVDEDLRSLEEVDLAAEEAEQRQAELEETRARLVDARTEIEQEARANVRGRFPGDPEAQWRSDNLVALVEGTRAFDTPQTGLLASMEKRLARAGTIEDETVGDVFDDWMEAIDAIASSEHYGGLELSEQIGLVPIGADPDSGLWEFWHVESGSRPEWSPDDGVNPTEEMGIVLVLIPGGTFWMGASRDPASPNHDPEARSEAGPVHEVTLEPYLLSKYELTQGQWFRLTREQRSHYGAGSSLGGNAILDSNPVTNVSWEDCRSILPRFGLRLPTEAQWERAARAESSTPLWCGDAESIPGPGGEGVAGNIFDQGSLGRGAPASWGIPEEWVDGHTVHAPVGSFRANGFGLHDVIGNVWEWCEDAYDSQAYSHPFDAEDGHRLLGTRADGTRVNRGGSFSDFAVNARSARRIFSSPADRIINIGLRVAQGITSD